MVGLLPNTDINRKISGGLQTIPRFRSRYSRFVVLMRYALPVVAGVVFQLDGLAIGGLMSAVCLGLVLNKREAMALAG